VICLLDDLARGATTWVTLRISVNPSITGIVIYSASVAAKEPDHHPLDNTAVEETTIDAQADLNITR
jgi:hypothetical protein